MGIVKILSYIFGGLVAAILFSQTHLVVRDVYTALMFGILVYGVANLISGLVEKMKKSKAQLK
ncbi:hypothetical protein [Chromobacterium indicum]